jgi:hypothetical protein
MKRILIALFLFLVSTIVAAGVNNKDNKDNNDSSVCYYAPGVAFRFNVKYLSLLVNSTEAAKFSQPVQTAYSVYGKAIEFGNFSTMDGTIIVGSPTKNSNTSGARLGFNVHSIRGEGGQETEFPETFNCTSDEATPTPSSWNCFIRDESGRFSEGSTVFKGDPLVDGLCSKFM